ncbi:MAG: serine acetyltransferase [Myxococcales bacterium FL481]|nr:MAG: serine acetyltransferase [Myxococcales bacterium FL481]
MAHLPTCFEGRPRKNRPVSLDRSQPRWRRPKTLGELVTTCRADYHRHGGRLTERTVWAMLVFRFGQYTLSLRFPPWRWAASKIYGLLRLFSVITTGVQMDARLRVGEDLHLIHAEGPISIHPDAIIGDRCGIMHNVTIGTNMSSGTPTIGDDVFIGVGACILGGVTIGDRVRISANSLVMTDMPDDSTVIGVPARPMPRLNPLGQNRTEARSNA